MCSAPVGWIPLKTRSKVAAVGRRGGGTVAPPPRDVQETPVPGPIENDPPRPLNPTRPRPIAPNPGSSSPLGPPYPPPGGARAHRVPPLLRVPPARAAPRAPDLRPPDRGGRTGGRGPRRDPPVEEGRRGDGNRGPAHLPAIPEGGGARSRLPLPPGPRPPGPREPRLLLLPPRLVAAPARLEGARRDRRGPLPDLRRREDRGRGVVVGALPDLRSLPGLLHLRPLPLGPLPALGRD